jgi:hypothetical protein
VGKLNLEINEVKQEKTTLENTPYSHYFLKERKIHILD